MNQEHSGSKIVAWASETSQVSVTKEKERNSTERAVATR